MVILLDAYSTQHFHQLISNKCPLRIKCTPFLPGFGGNKFEVDITQAQIPHAILSKAVDQFKESAVADGRHSVSRAYASKVPEGFPPT
jgi:hypothetical protein